MSRFSMKARTCQPIEDIDEVLSMPRVMRRERRYRQPVRTIIERMTHGLRHRRFARGLIECTAQRSKHARSGQALVEFTLVFMLMLVVAWIPADFGLAFYTGQLTLNAAREGARIAAASNPIDEAEVAAETCKRASMALFRDPGSSYGTSCAPYSRARVEIVFPVAPPGAPTGWASCNQQVEVTVTGDYNYTFYQFLRFFGAPIEPTVRIERSTKMRWEHQNSCG
jgi:Flp pilus assembly protein TadG